MAKIAVDCDGVISKFESGVVSAANHLWPGRLPADWCMKTWDMEETFTPAEFEQVWAEIKRTQNFWLSLAAYNDSVCALERFLIASHDHDVWIVTSRAETAGMTVAKQTDLWLRCCGIRQHHNYLAVLPVEDSKKKVDIYAAVGIEWSVDDKPETIRDCDALPGHRAYLLSRPWNAEAQPKRRIASLSTFFNDIAAART